MCLKAKMTRMETNKGIELDGLAVPSSSPKFAISVEENSHGLYKRPEHEI